MTIKLYFITGNKNKFAEAKAIISDLEQLDIDLPEIQDIDAHKIVRAKLKEAFHHHKGEFIIEDTSLYLECLNGLPGPLVKWFLETIGSKGIYEIANKFGNSRAEAKTIIGYAKNENEIEFFEGILSGDIVGPRGDKDFGWGLIFQPEGHDKTFGEMERDEKHSLSMRGLAFKKLREHLK